MLTRRLGDNEHAGTVGDDHLACRSLRFQQALNGSREDGIPLRPERDDEPPRSSDRLIGKLVVSAHNIKTATA